MLLLFKVCIITVFLFKKKNFEIFNALEIFSAVANKFFKNTRKIQYLLTMISQNFLMVVLLLPIVTPYRDHKNNKEIVVALEIFKELNIGHCMLVVKNLHSIILNPKEIYNDTKFIAYIQIDSLEKFLGNIQSFYKRIGFVIDIDSIAVLQNIFKEVS